MDPDDASPATATSSSLSSRTGPAPHPTERGTRPHRDEQPTAFVDGLGLPTDALGMQLEFLTVLVAVVGAGLIFEGFVATFAGVFCLSVVAFVLGRLAIAEWRRLELSTTE